MPSRRPTTLGLESLTGQAEPVELPIAHDTPASNVARNCGGLRCLVTCSNA
jgi:hypothetical protein